LKNAISIFLFSFIINSGVFGSCGYGNFSLIEKLHSTDQLYEAFIFKVDSTIILPDYSYKSYGKLIENNLFKRNIEIYTGGNTTAGGTALIPNQIYFVIGGVRNDGNYFAFVCDGHSRLIDNRDDSISVNNFINQFYKERNNFKTGRVSYSISQKLLGSGKLKAGLPDGKWKYYYSDGTLWSMIEYKKGKIIKERNYTRQGNVESISIRSHIKKIDKRYNYKGQLTFKSTKKYTGQLEDDYRTYFFDSGKLKSKSTVLTLKPGMPYLDNKYKEFDEGGKIISCGSYYHGIKVGPWFEFDKNNNSSYIKDYPDIEINDSLSVWYHSNGKIASTGKIEKGMKQGLWIALSEKGDTICKGFYLNNLEHSLWKIYDQNGRISRIGEYRNGERVGPWTDYNSKNGNIRSTMFYKKDKIDGELKSFYQNGNIESIYDYNLGNKNGNAITYFENGRLMSVSKYSNGNINGSYIEYYENGETKEEGNYVGGFPVGTWKYYNSDGGLVKSEKREKPTFKIGDPH